MKIQGQIDLPGDKSISHRALMIASLSMKTSTIRNLASGKDVKSTENCLKKCNISISGKTNIEKIITGYTFQDPRNELDCGNSGTTIRLLSGLLASRKIKATLIGDESLSKRPMGRIIRPLLKMNLSINAKNNKTPSVKKDSSESFNNLLNIYNNLELGPSDANLVYKGIHLHL